MSVEIRMMTYGVTVEDKLTSSDGNGLFLYLTWDYDMVRTPGFRLSYDQRKVRCMIIVELGEFQYHYSISPDRPIQIKGYEPCTPATKYKLIFLDMTKTGKLRDCILDIK